MWTNGSATSFNDATSSVDAAHGDGRITSFSANLESSDSDRYMWVLLLVGFDVNSVGEPDAGKPHVRFDERSPETEQQRDAVATAPAVDSTQ